MTLPGQSDSWWTRPRREVAFFYRWILAPVFFAAAPFTIIVGGPWWAVPVDLLGAGLTWWIGRWP